MKLPPVSPFDNFLKAAGLTVVLKVTALCHARAFFVRFFFRFGYNIALDGKEIVSQQDGEAASEEVLPTTVNNFLLGSKKVFPVNHGYAKCNHWEITIHDGLPCLREPWFQYISENNLMPGDEVMFFFRFDKHVWEIQFKQEIS
ncbi:hypothetical protein JHK87_016198 [Glycine soja]|nr:hypothetical protein JHK87_016198 [Glycine soja]